MYKYILQSVEGIEWFAITALLIFFGTFCFALYRVWSSQKTDMEAYAKLPLED